MVPPWLDPPTDLLLLSVLVGVVSTAVALFRLGRWLSESDTPGE